MTVKPKPNGATVDANLASFPVRGRIGFFACAAGRGRLVRCALIGEGKPPRFAKVNCPHCGLTHEATMTWRKPTPLDEGHEAEVVIEAVEAVPS